MLENRGVYFCELYVSKYFLDIALNAQEIKDKTYKLDFIKIKNFCTSKDTTRKVKKTSHRLGENICKSCIW